jgi:hypothetical protein
MPIFDRSASRPNCAEAGLLRSVPGLAQPNSLSFQLLPLDDRRRQRRASAKPQPSPGAAPISPPAAAQAPVRAHAKAWRALPALSLSEMTSWLWPDDPGEPSADERLVADAHTGSGAPYARGC